MNRRFEPRKMRSLRFAALSVAASAALLTAGCAGGGSAGNSGPRKMALPAGSTCPSILSELRKMDRRGVPDNVDAANRGRKLSGKAQGDVDRYNRLLSQYLGARCHA